MKVNEFEVTGMLGDMVNNTCYNQKEFVDGITMNTHRYLQQEVFKLMLKTIEAWSNKDEYGFDSRNEYTVFCSKEIIKHLKEKGLF